MKIKLILFVSIILISIFGIIKISATILFTYIIKTIDLISDSATCELLLINIVYILLLFSLIIFSINQLKKILKNDNF